jgi:hypothetical protein
VTKRKDKEYFEKQKRNLNNNKKHESDEESENETNQGNSDYSIIFRFSLD